MSCWVYVGFLGQAMFSLRFLTQWITSEKKRESVIDSSFWYISLASGILLLAYAVSTGDPVFIIGQAVGIFIYCRNIQLIRKKRQQAQEPSYEFTKCGS